MGQSGWGERGNIQPSQSCHETSVSDLDSQKLYFIVCLIAIASRVFTLLNRGRIPVQNARGLLFDFRSPSFPLGLNLKEPFSPSLTCNDHREV